MKTGRFLKTAETAGIKKLLFAGNLILLLTAGCNTGPRIPVVENFSPAAYMGTWYEIARMPNYFEKDMTDVMAEYQLLPDGRVKVINSGWKNGRRKTAAGILRTTGDGKNGMLEVSFFGPFFSSYRIVKLAPDCRYSVVTGKNTSLLWILARQKTLSPEDRREILCFLRQYRVPVEKLIWTDDTGKEEDLLSPDHTVLKE